MKYEEVLLFEKVATQLQSFHSEMSVLVKKAPNDAVNKFKLDLINRSIQKANLILKDRVPFDDFNGLDVDMVPSNSDVAIVLSQYINCLEDIRKDNLRLHIGQWYWEIEDCEDNVKSYLPSRYITKH